MDILNSRLKYAVIGGLIIVIVILYIAVKQMASRPDRSEEVTPTPVESFPPTITPVEVRISVPPLNDTTRKEFQYPVKFEEISVVYKPNSGTFIVYYLGDPAVAKASFGKLMERENINPAQYLIDYRSLEPNILPDRPFPEGE